MQAKDLSPFLKSGHIFARDHSLGISLASIDCWNRWANTGPNSEASSFRTLGWSSSGPEALDGFKRLRSLVTPTAKTNNIIHERSRPIWERDLAVLIFVEHIRKLTIKFICLFQFRFSNAITISLLKRWDTLSVFLLTIYVSIEVSGISLNVSNQVTDRQIVLLFDIALYFPSQSFKFWPKFTTASLFRFYVCFISSTNLPSYLRGYPRDRRYRSTGFRGDMLISRLLNKGSFQIKIFLNRAIIRVTIEVPIFCKVKR